MGLVGGRGGKATWEIDRYRRLSLKKKERKKERRASTAMKQSNSSINQHVQRTDNEVQSRSLSRIKTILICTPANRHEPLLFQPNPYPKGLHCILFSEKKYTQQGYFFRPRSPPRLCLMHATSRSLRFPLGGCEKKRVYPIPETLGGIRLSNSGRNSKEI